MKDTLIDWLGTFWKALTSPTPETFLAEAKKADGKFASAVGWMVFYGIYVYTLTSIAFGKLMAIPILLTVVLVAPLSTLLFSSAAYFICQRLFRKKEYVYDKLLYLTVSISLPIFLIITPIFLFSPGWVLALLSFILLFYQAAMLIIAIKTIADIEYWQALVGVFLSIVVGILAGVIAFLAISATITPPRLIKSS
ncbi:MAG: hypothetical protein WA821_04675 [Anaerolineales bacterium]